MKRARKNVDGGGVDRISQLPESIIHRIMALLSPKEIVGTSVLSKTWYHFKASYPVLEFNEMHFADEEHYPNLDKFRQVIYNSLNHFNRNKLGLVAFSIDIFSPLLLSSDLYNWIRLALENGVRSLHLRFQTRPILAGLSILSQPLISSETLAELNLTRCILEQPLSIFSSIRKLSLVFCCMKGPIFLKNDDCPFLEHLVLKFCLGVKSFHISNLCRLHTLSVSFGSHSFELVVASQSIQTLYIYALSKPWSIINIDGCHHLKLLYLQSLTITDKELDSLLSKLTLIEELYLNYCHHLETIKISNPCLKTFIFVCAVSRSSHLRIIEIAAPSLENFIFSADSRVCRINVTGCCNLKTLVLKNYMGPETTFHDLLYKCPFLENLWTVQCTELERLELLNPRLKTVHVVRCCKLNAMKVDSPNLFEFCCTTREAPRITVVGGMKASGGVRFESEHSSHWYYRLKEVLAYSVGLDSVNFNQLFLNIHRK